MAYETPREINTPSPVSPDAAFQQALATSVARGWEARHVDASSRTAVLYSPAGQVNHVAHLLGTLVTCGLWLVVWIIVMARAQPAKSMTLTVDSVGQAHFTQPIVA